MGFPGGTKGKEPACQCRRCKRCGFDLWVGKISWRRAWQPTSVMTFQNIYMLKIRKTRFLAQTCLPSFCSLTINYSRGFGKYGLMRKIRLKLLFYILKLVKKKKKFKKEDYVTETIVVPQQLKYLTLYTKKFDRHQWYFHPNRVSLSQTSAETTPSANFSFNLLQP